MSLRIANSMPQTYAVMTPSKLSEGQSTQGQLLDEHTWEEMDHINHVISTSEHKVTECWLTDVGDKAQSRHIATC